MIIVFGSLDVDIIMPVERFPHPGETVLCSTDYLTRSGGKGSNQAIAAAKAGAKVAFVGKVGDDAFGRRSVSNLKSNSVWTAGIGISERPTGCGTIIVDTNGANFVTVAPGANLDTTADQVPDEILIPKNVLLTQLEVPAAEVLLVLARARKNGVTTILNASPSGNIPAEALSTIDYLIVNEIESLQLAQSLSISEKNPAKLALEIAKRGNLTCIITLEERGSVAAHGGLLFHAAAMKVDVVDTTGAGDAFCGIFAACVQAGMNWKDALHRAGIGASLSCLGLGSQEAIPSSEDIERHLADVPAPKQISV